MAEPFLSELRLMTFNFPPKGWALADGQLLPINQNQGLFSLLGTTFGGDGRVNFALPDLRGRTPIHVGGSFTLGERGGEQTHTLSVGELPSHTHAVDASSADGVTPLPSQGAGGGVLSKSPAMPYAAPRTLVAMAPQSLSSAGGSQAHLNMQPFLTLNFCIALQGIFPSPT